MTIDIIILSNTINLHYYDMLRECLISIKNSKNITSYIIVVETNKKLKGKLEQLKLPIDVFYVPDDETFNYNKFQNYGLKFSKNKFICFSNNDVIYQADTMHTLVSYLSVYDSVSPWEQTYSPRYFSRRGVYEGYNTRQHLTGWCFCTTRDTINKIGGQFDESFSFWYADDDYAKLLEANNLKHALIGDTTVVHLVEQSRDLLGDTLENQTTGQQKIFNNKWSSN
jgi:GT2 family glycosyltransferase